MPISVQVVLVAMLGGAGSIMGPVIGAAILLPISEGTRVWLGFKGTGIDMIVYGTLIMLISVYQPQGVWGLLSRIGGRGHLPPAGGRRRGGEEEAMSAAPLLEVQGVTKRFGGLLANDNISFTVNEGEIVGIIGPNGVREEHPLQLHHRLLPARRRTGPLPGEGHHPPQRGPDLQAGDRQDVPDRPGDQRHDGAGECHDRGLPAQPQESERRGRKAEEVLRFTGLWEKRDAAATSLTIADKKRLEVSMALATQPKLLMLDEAMAGLTPVELKEMMTLVRKVRENGITLVIVEHVMEAVMELSDRVIVINSGRKIVEDVPEEIVVNPEVIRAYLGERYHARH